MGLRDRAKRAAEERDRNDRNSAANMAARKEQDRRSGLDRLYADLKEWSKCTGIPIRKMGKPTFSDTFPTVTFRTDDRIVLRASIGLVYNHLDEAIGARLEVHYNICGRNIQSLADLDYALNDSTRR